MSHISVIIPVFNEESNILTSIKSALMCDQNIEVIVSDSGSIDGTVKLVTSTYKDFPNVLIARGGTSRSSCQNIGVSVASGDIVLFLHADTVLPLNYADEVRKCLTGNYDTILSFHTF